MIDRIREAENARDAAKKQLEGHATGGSDLPNLLQPDSGAGAVATPEMDARIDAQRRNLDALMQRYTEQHPDVVSTKRLIKELEDQRRREVAELRKAAAAAAATAAEGRTTLHFGVMPQPSCTMTTTATTDRPRCLRPPNARTAPAAQTEPVPPPAPRLARQCAGRT